MRAFRGMGWVGVAAATLAGLGGCAVMSKSDCQKADWTELGLQDAMKGKPVSRFDERSAACQKAGEIANPQAYRAGHAQGQIGYCTTEQGKDDATGGNPPAELCSQPLRQPYHQGYAEGLMKFCTARNGYDLGRHGFRYRDTCTPDLAASFEIGFSAGKEVYELNQRLDRIKKAGDEERRMLDNPKTSRVDRDAINRRLGQLDSDEASVRGMLRQAEAAALTLVSGTSGPQPVSRSAAAQWLPGQWQLATVKFGRPVDLNRDGVASEDALNEFSACERDSMLELAANEKAFEVTGANVAGCPLQTVNYSWRAGEVKVPESRNENGRRVVTERLVYALQLRDSKRQERTDMWVDVVNSALLVVRRNLRDGGDSTSEAVLTYRRIKR